ncbi:MAG: hypothetical protein FMNOHCHN_03223 [Ignavibacteriaceae bacterium]|nr:hypothetical protein [Ignavibacteriaceae bacterium]
MRQSKIQELLFSHHTDRIDPISVLGRFPWLAQRNQNCILSPDSDGLLCGLLMSHYFGWNIKGFYDGKILVLEQGTRAVDCIFLDMEVFREPIRSVGQHMLLYNRNQIPGNWENFANCFSPNNLRSYDGQHNFRLKYPFGTIHLLLAVLWLAAEIVVQESAITPLLFADGTWMNLLGYTENSLNWIYYLRADDTRSPLHQVFVNDHYSLYELMVAMDHFLRRRDELSVSRERGDRIAITLRGGDQLPHNLELRGTGYAFRDEPKKRGESFIRILSELTEWNYHSSHWTWENWQLYQFTKGTLGGEIGKLNNRTFQALMEQEPLSFAMTAGNTIEYTLEQPQKIM